MRSPRRWIGVLALGLALLGTWQVASAGWIHAKAFIAQRLVAAAWMQVREGGVSRRPWPWADMRPIARLTVRSRNLALYVFDDASARSLAFGPGYVSGTARPGSWGNTVIVAHRDTHFAFLAQLALDDEIELETPARKVARYRVRELTVIEKGEARLLDEADRAQLTLITCYPFDAVMPGTPLRYVVVAERVA